MRKQIVVFLASLAILPLASGSSEPHLRGEVSPEVDIPMDFSSKIDKERSFLGTHVAVEYPSFELMTLVASQPAVIKQIRSPKFQNLVQKANLPKSILDIAENAYFPTDVSGVPTPQHVRTILSDKETQKLFKNNREFKVFLSSEAVINQIMQHFYRRTSVEDIIVMASTPEVIHHIRDANLFQKMEYLGLSHELAEILGKVFFPKDGKAPSSEEVKIGLSSSLIRAILESTELQTVLRSEDVVDSIPWFFRPTKSVAEFIEIYSHPAVVEAVKSDEFTLLVRKAGIDEDLLHTFLAIYKPRSGEKEDEKPLSDYVREKLSTPVFESFLREPEFRSVIFSAPVSSFIMSNYPENVKDINENSQSFPLIEKILDILAFLISA